MGKSEAQKFDEEEEKYRKRVGAILWVEGHVEANQHRAGFQVKQYNGLTFVYFDDPGSIHQNHARRAKVQKYQEALSKHHISLSFHDEDPATPYLCG